MICQGETGVAKRGRHLIGQTEARKSYVSDSFFARKSLRDRISVAPGACARKRRFIGSSAWRKGHERYVILLGVQRLGYVPISMLYYFLLLQWFRELQLFRDPDTCGL